MEYLSEDRISTPSSRVLPAAINEVKADQEINNSLGTTIVVIDTRIMIPEASFTYSLDGTKVKFNSTAKYVTSVLWDFGDGTTSTELNPEHVYDDLGIYDVTLNAKGISGDASYTLRLKLIQAAVVRSPPLLVPMQTLAPVSLCKVIISSQHFLT